MKLEETKKYLDRRIDEGFLDTYVVMVTDGGDEGLISSPNAGADTLFDIASMGKVLVTATLILRAAGEGLLGLDDTLAKYYPDCPDEKRKITLRELLLHTSGILRVELPDEVVGADAHDIVMCGKRGSYADIITPEVKDRIARYVLSRPLGFAPSTSYVYSCCGYLLLGFIAEKVYGDNLDILFDKYIKQPLGLTRSCFDMPEGTPDSALTHYRAAAGDCMVADSIVYKLHGVAGNGASFWTANDIRRYILALLDYSELLYPREYYDLAERDYTPDFEEGRGLGWLIVDSRYKQTGRLFPRGSFGHCGNTGTSFYINRELGRHAIILTNATRFSYMAHDYKYCDYNSVMLMREDIHNAILRDISFDK